MNNILKKLSISIVSLLLISAIFVSVLLTNTNKVSATNDKTAFSNEISAVTPYNNELVTIVPRDLKEFYDQEKIDFDQLKNLYEYNQGHRDFMSRINTVGTPDELIREIYRETDAFLPENNILKWNSSLEDVESYKVRVAYDNKFTKCCLIVDDADVENGVVFANPLANTTYYWQVIATLNGGDKIYSNIFSFTTTDTIRTVEIDGVSNTRDIGGYQTAYGYIKQGLVYRSARLESISEKGLNTLKNELGVKTELDLRGYAEATNLINKQNVANLDNYYCYTTPQYVVYLLGGINDKTGEAIDTWEKTETDPRAAGLLNSVDSFENVKNIFTVFTDKNNYPIDFHCAVGRDRTGTVAAVLKGLLGYSETDIEKDYYTSVFATTGAFEKNSFDTSKDMILFTIQYLNSFSGETFADRVANYLINKCGMTQEQIDTIRNIMTGKEGFEVDIPMDHTIVDADNYSEYSIVTFNKYGVKNELILVKNGETVEAPYVLENGYSWTLDGVTFDLSTPVNSDLTLKAVKEEVYNVKINKTGDIKEVKNIEVKSTEVFDISSLAVDGYSFIVVTSNGKVGVKNLTIDSDCVINVIYTKN